jgi:glycerophosphoryl diester phosphodiesterase
MVTGPPSPPIVIAHRGACGYRPEHTLASYALAVELGADYLEPDLVSTRDGVLVARHENEIGATTDVARRPEFAARRTTKLVDGRARTGWFTEDFTLAELKTLRAVERIPQVRPGNTLYDRWFTIPTLQEVVDLAQQASERTGRTIGVYPETKLPSYFAALGLALEEPLVDMLKRNGYRDASDPVFVQSFEVGNLRALAVRTQVRLVQLLAAAGQPYDVQAAGGLLTYDDLASPRGLAEVATYASAIGPAKERVLTMPADSEAAHVTSLVDDAHRAGLLVHAYTFRNENAYLPVDLRVGRSPADYGHALAEYRSFLAAGVDGVFSDNPDTARLARDEQLARAAPAA